MSAARLDLDTLQHTLLENLSVIVKTGISQIFKATVPWPQKQRPTRYLRGIINVFPFHMQLLDESEFSLRIEECLGSFKGQIHQFMKAKQV